ncbi:hypothetical protein AGOR_G00134740 [Albula goreensis]|uniref:Uncharacterized protein n=1 Tax=Albula goreensis TaxID=1534307 RepID=A0A8T3D8T8_9TELE|nr:hypothetical protein AGOR_G00134740 [Albula goreensis]
MWNVPPTRRYSHDETDMWTTGQIPSYLHRWGSTEDIIGIPHYSSPRHERRRSSLVSYHEESGPYRKRRKSEDSVHSLKQLPRGERYEEDFKCFSRDEVINFIDETPLPSPMKSPRRASAISLIPDVYEQRIILYPHFPLTDFEREPQALRRFSEHRKGCVLVELPENSSRPDCGREVGEGGSGACASGKGCHQSQHGGKRASELAPPGHAQRTGEHSSHRFRTGPGEGSWGDQKNLTKVESKGSTNSFLSSPSASSGYITFHSDSIGSTT